uniref:Uncharacterized protein n=1 Tax=Neospora caninum (strain Liverpool) TaxID=572307 RepID=F0JB10_NEOCL|nr:hypothetical protein, conserved [Neospora caninum Liverpool]CEL71276.1 TPA: hypothetical protein, conserved [Neospora caninum Liverpool]
MASLGDAPYLLRQRLTAFRHWYGNSSLFTKNVTFVFLGAVAGYFVGKAERQRRLAEGDLNRSVQVTFYTLPHTPSLSPSSPSSSLSSSKTGGEEKSEEWRQARKTFEHEWNKGATAVQRLPGYSWTQIYRLSPQQPQIFPLAAAERKGVFATERAPAPEKSETHAGQREAGSEKDGKTRRTERPPDYIQLRQWFGVGGEGETAESTNLRDIAAACMQTDHAQYEIVVDDSLVRIIQ